MKYEWKGEKQIKNNAFIETEKTYSKNALFYAFIP